VTVTVPPLSDVYRSGAPASQPTGPAADDVESPSFMLVITVTGYGRQKAPATPTAAPALDRDVVNFLGNLD